MASLSLHIVDFHLFIYVSRKLGFDIFSPARQVREANIFVFVLCFLSFVKLEKVIILFFICIIVFLVSHFFFP